MTYVFLATGFEDIEALAPIDILRRGGVDVTITSIYDTREVVSAHGMHFLADAVLGDVDLGEADLLVLPGGLPGSTNLAACAPLCEAIKRHHAAGKPLAAICAAPLVFGRLGLLQGVKATCYPGVESELTGATYTAALVERDGQFVTGKGPAAAMEFGYTLLDVLGRGEAAKQLREGMMYNFLTTPPQPSPAGEGA